MSKTSNNHDVIARIYAPSDRDGCLALFNGNVPAFFFPSDRGDFEDFLDRQAIECSYQVLERNGRIVGCGGIYVENDGLTAGLCWGMVDKELQGTGLGRMLAELRLRSAAATPGVLQVKLSTSQLTQGFYALLGFQVSQITRDGYGPGLDRWDMLLRLDGNQRQIWQARS